MEARKKRSLLPEDVINMNVHACLLFKFWNPSACRRRGASSTIPRYTKQKTLHPLRDEEFSPRYHPNYVFKLEHSNVSTSKLANVSLVAITGCSVIDYLSSPMKSLLRDNRRVRSCVLIFPYDTFVRLPPHSPYSLT